jgi:hypothetical protein
MRGPTAVGTACVSRSWTVLDQVGAKIRHRKTLPVLEPTHRGWGGAGVKSANATTRLQGLGGLGSNQQTSLLIWKSRGPGPICIVVPKMWMRQRSS